MTSSRNKIHPALDLNQNLIPVYMYISQCILLICINIWEILSYLTLVNVQWTYSWWVGCSKCLFTTYVGIPFLVGVHKHVHRRTSHPRCKHQAFKPQFSGVTFQCCALMCEQTFCDCYFDHISLKLVSQFFAKHIHLIHNFLPHTTSLSNLMF